MASHTDSPFVRTTTERSSLRNMRSAPIDAAVRGGASRDKESYYHNSGFVSDAPESRRTLQFAYSVSPPKSRGHGFAYPNGSSSQEKTPSGSVQSPDPYYKTKLRQGFINMRNSYNEKHRHKKSNVTRTLSRTPNTGPPSRLLAVEEKHAPKSVPAGHSELSSPRYEIAKVTTSHQGHQPSLPDRQHTLYRSNSSLDLGNLETQEELPRQPAATLHREYGSTSSLDVVNSSFFQMVQRIDQTDQRAPAPPMMQETLRGHVAQSDDDDTKDVSSPEQVPNGNAIIEPDPSSEEVTLSPKLHKKSHKHRDRKSRAKSVVGETSSGIFRRFIGSGKTEAADTSSKPADVSPDQEGKPEEKQRRKAFVHYDCQSVGFNIHDVLKRQKDLNQRRNTSTGASAASVLRTDITASDNDTSEAGDGKTNDLVLSCSFFRNEIGGEEESTICLNKTTVQQRAQQWLGNKSARTPGQRRKPICNGVAILDTSAISQGVYPSSVASNKGLVIEYVDAGSYYYRDFFNEQDHQNYFGADDNLGPVAVSIRRERVIERETSSGKPEGGGALFQYRLIVRTSELLTLRGCVLEDAIPTSSRLSNTRGLPHKEVLEFVMPELQVSCLKQAIAGPKTYEQLLKLDEQRISKTYKIGIMYCKAGQSTEEEMYNNEVAGPAFEEFLELLGQRVKLKGFEKYLGGLDNKTDSSGLHSVYTSFYGLEIMFHVSTLLPFTENNKQQLMRKRHIGNDIVTIVFQEPNAQPFTPKTVRSHFQHVFIIVRVHHPNTEHVKYSVAVSRSKDVPAFGPPFPDGALFTKSVEFADFLLTKAINAENAAHRSEKFTAMATRTRQEYLKDLANNYVSTTPLDSGSKLSKFSLGSGRKKDKAKSRTIPDMFARGGIVWNVQVEDYSQSQEVDCSLGIAADIIVLMEDSTKEVIFAVYCPSVLGWTSQQNSLRLYFDKGESIVITTSNSEVDEVQEIISRLSVVTQGCETKELTLHRQHDQQLGFHVHIEGIVTQVEPYSAAWHSGLRTGSRLVEICKEATASLTHDQMVDLLRKSHTVKIVVIPAHEDGSPRRSIEEPRPGYLSKITASAPAPPPRGQESRMVTGLDPVFASSQNYVDVRAVRVDSSYSAKHNKQSSQDSAASRSSGQGSMDGLATDNRNHPYDIGYASGGTPSSGGTGTKTRLTNMASAASQHDMRMHAYALYGKERAERAGKPSPPSTLETPAQKTSASVSNLSQYSDWSSSRSSSSSGPRQGQRSYANEERRGRSPAVEDIPPPVPPPPVEDLEPQLQEPTRSSHGLQPNLGPRSHHRFPSMSPANSRGSSPATSRMNLSQLPLEDSPRSRGRSKSGHARLVPSRSVQEDLKKLINPDINFTQEQDVSPDPPRGRTNPLLHRTLSEDSLFGIHNKSKPLAMDVSGDVIFTTSSSQVPPLKDSTDIENRLSAQATSERSHNLAASTPSLKITDTGLSQEWSDLVRTATKAMTDEREPRQQETNKAKASDATPRRERSSSRPSPIPTSQERQPHHASGHDSHSSSLDRSRGSDHPVDLRARCTQLEEELMKERRLRFEEQQWRMELEEEILRLKEDNIRLQEESQTAAAQLRRFTEWFFNTIDKQ